MASTGTMPKCSLSGVYNIVALGARRGGSGGAESLTTKTCRFEKVPGVVGRF